eukprot:2965639-Lingulodinium_polyedra.AAC.1
MRVLFWHCATSCPTGGSLPPLAWGAVGLVVRGDSAESKLHRAARSASVVVPRQRCELPLAARQPHSGCQTAAN